MSLNTSITKELLFAYFSDQVSALQKQMILQWLEEPGNEEFFFMCLHEWEIKNMQYAANTNQAIGHFNEKLRQAPDLVASNYAVNYNTYQAPSVNWYKWLVAASVILVLGFGSWFWRDTILYKSYSTGYGQTSQIHLSDGSKVALNANSVLRVPRFGFGSASRQLFLKGEANFSVVHQVNHQKFTVLTDSVFKVEVLGTEFTVFARPRQTKVVLYKGKVKVLYGQLEKAPVTMAPGDLITVDKKQKKLQRKKVSHPENFAAWQQNRFVFDNTSLTEIKSILEENYGLRVALNGENLAHKTISGSFKAKTASELLQAISEVLEINVIRENEQVTLTDYH